MFSGGRGCTSGDGTSSLCVSLGYHQNPNDNIGFGDLVVKSDPGLANLKCECYGLRGRRNKKR